MRGGPWRGVSLTTRILAVNVIVLALIAFSLLYIDSYRREVLGERFKRASGEAEIAAEALAQASDDKRAQVLTTIGRRHALRLRLSAPMARWRRTAFCLLHHPSIWPIPQSSRGICRPRAFLIAAWTPFWVRQKCRPIVNPNHPYTPMTGPK
jgi:hypothetical protein